MAYFAFANLDETDLLEIKRLRPNWAARWWP